MSDNRINISIMVTEDGFFTNASHESGFVCTMAQDTLDLSIASALPFIRSYADEIISQLAVAACLRADSDQTVAPGGSAGLAARTGFIDLLRQLAEEPDSPLSQPSATAGPIMVSRTRERDPFAGLEFLDFNLPHDVIDALLDSPAPNDSLGHSDQQTFIVGRGWVDLDTINCVACGDEGRVVREWSDEGDPENGPCPVVTVWEFCSCPAGQRASDEDQLEQEAYWESRRNLRNRLDRSPFG